MPTIHVDIELDVLPHDLMTGLPIESAVERMVFDALEENGWAVREVSAEVDR